MKKDINDVWEKCGVFSKLAEAYRAQVNHKALEKIKAQLTEEHATWEANGKDLECDSIFYIDTCCPDFVVFGHYEGSVFNVFPSGKFYMPWTSNQTDKDVLKDEIWRETIEEELEKHGLSLEHGEGDPCDIFLTMGFDTDLDE